MPETGVAGGCAGLAAIGGTRSFSVACGFFGAWTGFGFAGFGETGTSFPAELDAAVPRSQASSADESTQAVACESIAGSLLEKPSGTANNTAGRPCGVEVRELNSGLRRRTVPALALLFFGWFGTIADTLFI